jgi:hypothetical protein
MRMVRTGTFWWGLAAGVAVYWAWQRFGVSMMAPKQGS